MEYCEKNNTEWFKAGWQCCWGNSNPDFKATINNFDSIFPYLWNYLDGECTLYLVQNCQAKKPEVEKKEVKPEWWFYLL